MLGLRPIPPRELDYICRGGLHINIETSYEYVYKHLNNKSYELYDICADVHS